MSTYRAESRSMDVMILSHYQHFNDDGVWRKIKVNYFEDLNILYSFVDFNQKMNFKSPSKPWNFTIKIYFYSRD